MITNILLETLNWTRRQINLRKTQAFNGIGSAPTFDMVKIFLHTGKWISSPKIELFKLCVSLVEGWRKTNWLDRVRARKTWEVDAWCAYDRFSLDPFYIESPDVEEFGFALKKRRRWQELVTGKGNERFWGPSLLKFWPYQKHLRLFKTIKKKKHLRLPTETFTDLGLQRQSLGQFSILLSLHGMQLFFPSWSVDLFRFITNFAERNICS